MIRRLPSALAIEWPLTYNWIWYEKELSIRYFSWKISQLIINLQLCSRTPNALKACADGQGRFIEMHRILRRTSSRSSRTTNAFQLERLSKHCSPNPRLVFEFRKIKKFKEKDLISSQIAIEHSTAHKHSQRHRRATRRGSTAGDHCRSGMADHKSVAFLLTCFSRWLRVWFEASMTIVFKIEHRLFSVANGGGFRREFWAENFASFSRASYSGEVHTAAHRVCLSPYTACVLVCAISDLQHSRASTGPHAPR